MDVQPFQDQPWGFSGVFDRSNGGGFLDEIYPSAAKAIWDFEGIYATSRHIPGVKFPGLIHPGILGCAPSAEVLSLWNKREAELISANTLDRIVAQPPQPMNVHAGSATAEIKEKVGKEGARTIPGRPEHGGNCDIKNLSRGSKVFLPVHVPGAKFSVGDLHFSQGDGEISFCGAIEMVDSNLGIYFLLTVTTGWCDHHQLQSHEERCFRAGHEITTVPSRTSRATLQVLPYIIMDSTQLMQLQPFKNAHIRRFQRRRARQTTLHGRSSSLSPDNSTYVPPSHPFQTASVLDMTTIRILTVSQAA